MAKIVFHEDDYHTNKTLGALGYVLFFIPLVAAPKSAFGRFCANQGLLFLIAQIALSILAQLFWFIPFLGGIMNALFWVARCLLLFIALYYMYRAMNNDVRELPYIGQYQLIK